jgi:hypothetical protein
MVFPNLLNAAGTLCRGLLRELVLLLLGVLTEQIKAHNQRGDGPDDDRTKSEAVAARVPRRIAVYFRADNREALPKHVDERQNTCPGSLLAG